MKSEEDEIIKAIQKPLNGVCITSINRLSNVTFGKANSAWDVCLNLGGVESSLTIIDARKVLGANLKDLATLVKTNEEQNKTYVLLTSGLSERRQRAFREQDVFFIDTSGNSFLRAAGLFIDVRGLPVSQKTSSITQPFNVFSDKATLVIRTLFENDDLGIREIAKIANDAGFPLTAGYVSKVVTALISQGYARKNSDGKVSLRDRQCLLEDWVGFYAKHSPHRRSGFYLHASNIQELLDKLANALSEDAIIGGHASVNLVESYAEFDTVLVLSKDFDKTKIELIENGACEVERGFNIELIVPYYKMSAFYECKNLKKHTITSELQTYLDLTLEPLRGLEASEHILGSFLIADDTPQ